MHIQSIREIARAMEIKPSRRSKPELVRAIQQAEGNFPCFGTAVNGHCDQQNCLWREDCLRSRKPA